MENEIIEIQNDIDLDIEISPENKLIKNEKLLSIFDLKSTDYLKIKFYVENEIQNDFENDKMYDPTLIDFLNYRLEKKKIKDNIPELVNYGILAFYAGFFLEAYRNFIQASYSLENLKKDLSLEEYEETRDRINININHCKGKWNEEKMEFLRKETFFKPYNFYLKKNDIYIFSIFNRKNIMKEFIWKVCFSISRINPSWKIFFIDNLGQDIFIYINHENDKETFFLYKPLESDNTYLELIQDKQTSDFLTRIAISNYVIVNQWYFR